MNIHIPTPLRAYTDKKETVSVDGATVAEGLAALTAAYPTMQQHLYTPEGKLRSFVNVYLNDEDVRYLPAKEDSAVLCERRAHHYSFDRRRLGPLRELLSLTEARTHPPRHSNRTVCCEHLFLRCCSSRPGLLSTASPLTRDAATLVAARNSP